jgi:hypothetical protein
LTTRNNRGRHVNVEQTFSLCRTSASTSSMARTSASASSTRVAVRWDYPLPFQLAPQRGKRVLQCLPNKPALSIGNLS